MDFNGAGFSSVHIGQGLQDFIVHCNGLHCRTGDCFGFGHNPGQDVTDVPGGFTFGNHYRPVLVDDPNDSLSGNVSGRKNPHDTCYFFGRRAIYPADGRPGMVAKFQCRMQHSIGTQVINKGAGADRFVISVVFGLIGSHLADIW